MAARCRTHPEEAQLKEQDSAGNTILHWACRNHFPPEYRAYRAEPPPAELFVVEAILLACPELVRIPMEQMALPLHMACFFQTSSDIVRALVQAYPPAAEIFMHIEQRYHRLPLHALCNEGGETDSIRAVLEVREGAVSTRVKDESGHNAMETLAFRGFNAEISSLVDELRLSCKQDVLHASHNGRRYYQSNKTTVLLERIQRTGFWRKVEVLALAEYTQQPIAPGNQSLVNWPNTTIIRIFLSLQYCPAVAMEIACILRPKALMEKDELGDLPLHIATRQSCDQLIEKVLDAHPLAAAIPDASGALPLQIYIRRRRVKSWRPLTTKLIIVFPSAARNLNLDRRLYPLLWSRLNSAEERTAFFLSIQSCVDAFVETK